MRATGQTGIGQKLPHQTVLEIGSQLNFPALWGTLQGGELEKATYGPSCPGSLQARIGGERHEGLVSPKGWLGTPLIDGWLQDTTKVYLPAWDWLFFGACRLPDPPILAVGCQVSSFLQSAA